MKTKNLIVAICLLLALSSSPAGSVAAAPAQVTIPPNIKLTPVVSGLTQPVFATNAGDHSGRIFIVQQTGQIRIWNGTTLNATPFLDVSGIIKTGSEQGLLGLAFDPNYASNGFFYIVYTNQATVGDDVLARYKVSSGDPNVADAASAQIVLTVSEPETNHNGGMITFGPDGFLYFGLGDGGGGGDQHGTIGNGQDRTTLLGKILRLNLATVPYTIPPSNPYYGGSGTLKQEIWAYGVRNPWRFSFDKATGDLYIGDVGQNVQEEIDFQAAGAVVAQTMAGASAKEICATTHPAVVGRQQVMSRRLLFTTMVQTTPLVAQSRVGMFTVGRLSLRWWVFISMVIIALADCGDFIRIQATSGLPA